jgi:hypothetical protein
MQIQIEELNGVQVVKLQEDVVADADVSQVWEILRSFLVRNKKFFLLDMTKCEHIPKEFWHTSWHQMAMRALNNYGGHLAYLNPPDDFAEWLRSIGGNLTTPMFYEKGEGLTWLGQ